MSVLLNPYFSFRGDAREALEFYQGVFGGDLTINTFGEVPGAMADHQINAEHVMHGMLSTEDGLVLMAADTPGDMQAPPSTTAISLSGDDEATLRGHWDGLAAGGTVTQPLVAAPWGDTFGMLNDKFGIPWMVNILGPSHGQQG